MTAFLENALRAFVAQLSDAEDRRDDGDVVQVEFARFEADADRTYTGEMSRTLFGHVVYRLRGDDRDRRTRPLVVKQLPDACIDVDYCVRQMADEIHAYTTILPLLDGDASPAARPLFPDFVYGCLQTTAARRDGVLVLRHLGARGYRPAPRTVFLDHRHLSLMMRKLGQLHARSYAVAAKADPRRIRNGAKFVSRAREYFFGRYANFFRPLFGKYVRLLRRDPRYASSTAAFEAAAAATDDDFAGFLRQPGAEDESAAVVWCHGDYTAENVLFAYAADGRVPTDMRMLDLGLWRVTTPVLDLAHVLYLEADQRTRDQRWHSLLRDYRDGLRDLLPDDDHVPSTDRIQSLFKSDCLFAAVIASYWVPMKHHRYENAPIIDDEIRRRYPGTRPFDCAEEAIDEILEDFEDGGPKATEAVLNVMKDMIDRGFV